MGRCQGSAEISRADCQPLLFHSSCLPFIASFRLYLTLTSMSFGFSIGDFIAATELATKTLGLLAASENEANQNSVIILSFRSLQAQRIKELQQELYRISLNRVQALSKNEATLEDINMRLDVLLNQYGWSRALPARLTMTDEIAAEAIRNYETLSQEALDLNSLKRDSRTQSIIHHILGLPKPQYDFPGKELRKLLKNPKDPNLSLNFRELNKDIREAKMRKQAFSERIWMGALGGVAVIGPMLLMSLHRTLTTSLVTSSVATVLFTIVLALGARNLKGQEILGAVAAYAAVLVVFIGTSIPPIS
jgi:hypothetical protein